MFLVDKKSVLTVIPELQGSKELKNVALVMNEALNFCIQNEN